ncbi:hypothetical protein OE766_26130 [Pararhizobium sp. YC-54]|uniref:lysozyme inhibitor LprI family protein n=1 Tax=Pararhizobium sp. YC-54 TaxID=2986920 RepID=UPI0021F6C2A2|nr:hypothetical protein [Pararhizobium sp. YC-54]MCW0001703.1 hypothetical protein [Pararhizobium sp. YC-54]
MAMLFSSNAGPASAAQTFECRHAAGRAQVTICKSPSLLALDREISAVIDTLRAKAGSEQSAQQRLTDRLTKWLDKLNARCGARESCLIRAYKQGITSLQQEVRLLERKRSGSPDNEPAPDKNDKGRVIAKFFERDRWSYTGGDASAEVTEFSDGRGFLRVDVMAESGAFKYFAEPHGVLIVTDAAGKVIADAYASGLAMRMGTHGVFQQPHSGIAPVKAAEFSAAVYAFFSFKYCGWRQTFERTVGENNGCYQSSQRAEYRAFVADLAKALSGVTTNTGERFPILGWQGIKLR